MPTYRYRCTECGEEFELWQSITDESLRTHEDGCGGAVLKVLTPAGIVLKGSGFYKNDSRSSDGKRKSEDGSKPKQDDSGGSSEPTPSSSESGGDSSSDSGTGPKSGDATSSTTKPGDSKSPAGAAKPS